MGARGSDPASWIVARLPDGPGATVCLSGVRSEVRRDPGVGAADGGPADVVAPAPTQSRGGGGSPAWGMCAGSPRGGSDSMYGGACAAVGSGAIEGELAMTLAGLSW